MAHLVLVTKLRLGHALVWEALLPRVGWEEKRPVPSAPTKRSFADKGVPKLELGNEGDEGDEGERDALLKKCR